MATTNRIQKSNVTLTPLNNFDQLSDSLIFDDGAHVGIGATDRLSRLTIVGAADAPISGTTLANNSITINGVVTSFTSDVGIGDRISLSSAPTIYGTVTAINSNLSLTVDTPLGNGTSQTINVKHSSFRIEDSSHTVQLVINDNGSLGAVNPLHIFEINGNVLIDQDIWVNGWTIAGMGGITPPWNRQSGCINLENITDSVGIGMPSGTVANNCKVEIQNSSGTIGLRLTLPSGQSTPNYNSPMLMFDSTNCTGINRLFWMRQEGGAFAIRASDASFGNQQIFLKADTATGNVGINTENPTAKLEITKSTQDNTAGLQVSGNGFLTINPNPSAGFCNPLVQAGDKAIIFSSGTVEQGAIVIGQYSASSKGIRIDATGKIGIGTATPGYTLDVQGGDARIFGASYGGTGGLARLYLGDGNAGMAALWGTGLRFGVYKASGGGTLGSNSYDALAISETSGNVGIGKTNPGSKLDVAGAVTLEATTTPSNPSASSEGRLYVKANKLIAQFNDAGTIRYKYLDLTGTGVTWVHTTVAP